jgi:hypothetical protein
MSKRKLTERQKLERDLEEQIKLRELWKSGPREAWEAAIKQWVMRKGQLSASDLEQRNKAWLAMGSPDYGSPEWVAKLAELKNSSKRRQGKQPAPPLNTDPNDRHSLYWRYALLSAQHAAAQKGRGAPVDLVKTPGQRQERHTKEQQTEARRMYRWLWRNFPGLLRACDPELRKLIRRAGGVA